MIKDVEPLLKECEETLKELKEIGNFEVACYVQGFINSINKLPNVERPHGEWIAINNTHMGSEIHVCSECKNKRILIDTPFCPLCGAKMKEGDNS